MRARSVWYRHRGRCRAALCVLYGGGSGQARVDQGLAERAAHGVAEPGLDGVAEDARAQLLERAADDAARRERVSGAGGLSKHVSYC